MKHLDIDVTLLIDYTANEMAGKVSVGNYYEPVIWHQMGTKGQSKLRQKTHTMSGLRRPLVLPRPTYYDSTSEYNSIDDSLNRVEYFSNAVLEDQYDAALKSRGRDDALLRNANATIVSAEYQPTPHRSVSRRVRASTAPPAPRPSQQVLPVSNSSTKVAEEKISSIQSHPRPVVYRLPSPSLNNKSSKANTYSKPVVHSFGETPWYTRARVGSVPSIDLRGPVIPPRHRAKKPPTPVVKAELATSSLKASKPPPKIDVLRSSRARSVEPSKNALYNEVVYQKPIIPQRKIIYTSAPIVRRRQSRAMSEPRPQERASDYYFKIPEVKEKVVRRYTGSNRGRVASLPRPRPVSMLETRTINRSSGLRPKKEAAIIGSRMESEDGGKVRRPRSQYASNKLRELKIEDIERRYK